MGKRPRAVEGENLWDEITALKRERILGEAVELFYRKGYLPTSVDAVAERLGATKPFVYYHFKSKVDLLVEICERGTREALAVIAAAVTLDLGPQEKLERLVRDFTAVVLDHHKLVAIYFREQLNLPEEAAARIAAMRRDIDHHLRALLAEGREAGVFRFDNLAVASLIVAGMVSYAFAWYRESFSVPREEIAETMVAHVLRSLGAEPLARVGADGAAGPTQR